MNQKDIELLEKLYKDVDLIRNQIIETELRLDEVNSAISDSRKYQSRLTVWALNEPDSVKQTRSFSVHTDSVMTKHFLYQLQKYYCDKIETLKDELNKIPSPFEEKPPRLADVLAIEP